MRKLLLTIHIDPQEATLQGVSRRFGLGPTELDKAFGVVDLGSGGLYAILAEETAVPKITGIEGTGGPFADPVIGTY